MGKGLVVSALSADGLVEAIEAPAHRFCIGVQWHPEDRIRCDNASPLLIGAFASAVSDGSSIFPHGML
jgi:putative glutamine amidotransferase